VYGTLALDPREKVLPVLAERFASSASLAAKSLFQGEGELAMKRAIRKRLAYPQQRRLAVLTDDSSMTKQHQPPRQEQEQRTLEFYLPAWFLRCYYQNAKLKCAKRDECTP
jgi:hypothetical protein